MLRTSLTIVLLMALLSTSALADERLSNKELKKLFKGNTAIGLHIGKNLQIKDYYGKRGHFESLRSNGKKLSGKWWVSKNHDLLCVKYKHKPDKAYCRVVVKNSKGGYDKIRRKDGKVLIHYDSIVPGNKTKDK